MSTAQIVLHLHRLAASERRLLVSDELASEILLYLSGESAIADPERLGARIAQELQRGPTQLTETKSIRNEAFRRLASYSLFLKTVDDLGYTTTVLRSALLQHIETLEREPLGSDGNLIYVDITAALDKCGEPTREVVKLLIAGYGPQEVGEQLQTNGSRRVANALGELSRVLEGGSNGNRKSRSRRRNPRLDR